MDTLIFNNQEIERVEFNGIECTAIELDGVIVWKKKDTC